VLGGLSGSPTGGTSVSHTDSYRAKVMDDGSLGEWESLEPLPIRVAAHSALVAGRSVFIMGGVIDSSISDQVYRSTFKDDGKLDGWVKQMDLPQPRAHVHQSPSWHDRVYRVGGSLGGMVPKPDVALGYLVDE
jgi:hypothetical protein